MHSPCGSLPPAGQPRHVMWGRGGQDGRSGVQETGNGGVGGRALVGEGLDAVVVVAQGASEGARQHGRGVRCTVRPPNARAPCQAVAA